MLNTAITKLTELDNKGELRSFIANHPAIDEARYTMLHRAAMARLNEELGTNVDLSRHDVEKILMYFCYDDKEVSKFHRANNEHHNRATTDFEVLKEMMLDWESARYTKPDKPRNAYDTLYRWYPEMEDRMLPVIEQFGLDYPTPAGSSITMEEFLTLKDTVTVHDIVTEVRRIINLLTH